MNATFSKRSDRGDYKFSVSKKYEPKSFAALEKEALRIKTTYPEAFNPILIKEFPENETGSGDTYAFFTVSRYSKCTMPNEAKTRCTLNIKSVIDKKNPKFVNIQATKCIEIESSDLIEHEIVV